MLGRLLGLLFFFLSFPIFAQDVPAVTTTPSSTTTTTTTPQPTLSAPAASSPQAAVDSMANLKNCQPGNIEMPSLNQTYSGMSVKIYGMENGKCHMSMQATQQATQPNMPAATMALECYLSPSTIDALNAAQMSMAKDQAQGVDPATTQTRVLFMNAMKAYQSECSMTVNGKPVKF